MGPTAPALDRATRRPCELSTSPMAATTDHGKPGQLAAAALYIPAKDFGSGAGAARPAGGGSAEIKCADSGGRLTAAARVNGPPTPAEKRSAFTPPGRSWPPPRGGARP